MTPLLRAARPGQWIKNLACVLPVVFAGRLHDADSLVRALAAGAIYCLAASAVYLFNDCRDIERDRAHPVKQNRPIASGQVSTTTATVASVILAIAALGLGTLLGPAFAPTVAFYLGMNLLYSLALRSQPLVDVFWIAVGFCVRVMAGIAAIDARMSPWIVLATFFLMLTVGFGKRRAEMGRAGAAGLRPSLAAYTPALVDRWMLAAAGLAVSTYSLFAILSSPNPDLIMTVPFVVYGLFRYLMLAENGTEVEYPELIALKDRPSLINALLWLGAYILLAGRPASFFTR